VGALDNFLSGLGSGYQQSGGVTPGNVFSGPTQGAPDAPQGFAGGAGDFLGSLFGHATDMTLRQLPEFVKDPQSFFNDRGELSMTRVLSPDFRREKVKERKQAEDTQKAALLAQGFNQANKFFEGIMSQPTAGAAQEYANTLPAGALTPQQVEAAMRARSNADTAIQTAGQAVGYNPAVLPILDQKTALSGAEKQLGSKYTQEDQTHSGEVTRQNQAQSAGLSRETQRLGADLSRETARQVDESHFRYMKRGERFKAKMDRKKGLAEDAGFAQAIPAIIARADTPEGQAEFANNPAMSSMLGIAKAVSGNKLSPALGKELVKGIFHAGQSGVTVQGNPQDFPATPATQSRRQEEIDSAIGDINEMEWLESNFQPSYLTYAGRGKFAIQKQLNSLGLRQDAKSFLQKKAEFDARAQGGYLKFRKWVTGVAGEGNPELRGELSLAIPDINSDTAPDLFLAKLRSVKAARFAVADRLLTMGKKMGQLTSEDKTSLAIVALDAIRSADKAMAQPTQRPPVESMTRAEKEAEARRLLTGAE